MEDIHFILRGFVQAFATSERLQPLLKVPFYGATFREDHKGVRIDVLDDSADLVNLILGDHHEQDIGRLIGVGSGAVPVSHATSRLLQPP